MFVNLFEAGNDMRCLFCSHPVGPPDETYEPVKVWGIWPMHVSRPAGTSDVGNGYWCPRCRVYYFLNGNACRESVSDFALNYRNNTSTDGSDVVVPLVQDFAHGAHWRWCAVHRTYERDGSFDRTPCAVRVEELTPLLSG